MAISYHPKRGTIVTVNFKTGFQPPEMVKNRLRVVISPDIEARRGLCTVIPLSSSAPDSVQNYHYQFDIPFQLPPRWNNQGVWAKCDMINAVSLHRVELLRIGRGEGGKRIYQTNTLSSIHLKNLENAVLASLGVTRIDI